MQNAEQNHAETFAPLVAAGFPCPTPGEAFTIAGDITLGLAQGAVQALPAPWVLLAYSVDHLDEPAIEGPRQWRCMLLDNVEARGGEAFPCVPGDDDDEA